MLVKVKGKLDIPEDIIQHMDIKDGDKVEITLQEGGVLIRPIALLSKHKFQKIHNIMNIGRLQNQKRRKSQTNAAFLGAIRQPIRMIFFILLVGLATFGFVSRAVEYSILSREINRIEQFFRTTGSLVPIDPLSVNNVYEAASILQNSPTIQFHDRRSITQGVMVDQPNFMRGFRTVGGNIFMRGEPVYEYKGLHPFDSFVIMELTERIHRGLRLRGDRMYTTRVSFRPFDVIMGHNQFLQGRRYMADLPADADGNSVANDLRVGGRYLMRISRQSAFCNTLEIFPIMEGLYFVDITDRELLNYVWRALENELRILQENTNMLMLQGTKDMTALPMVQSGVIERVGGRFITHQDYEQQNYVMVVPRQMAALLGQTVTLTLRDMRTFENGAPLPPPHHPLHRDIPVGAEGHWANMPAGYWVYIPRDYTGDWRSYPTTQIEVTIVGTYHVSDAWNLPRWAHIRTSFRNIEVFVPSSIIPEGFGIVDAHMVSGAYNFVLNSPRDRVAFAVNYEARLEAMGFMVQWSGADPTNFWLSVTPIRDAIRLNLALFTAVLAVVLALTVFVYLRQRYKEFAIMRAMGVSDRSATWQVAMPVLVLWLPVVIAASVGAWFFALGQADIGLDTLAELDIPYDTAAALDPRTVNFLDNLRLQEELAAIVPPLQFSIVGLVGLTAVLLFVWVLAVLVGVRFFAGQSMILMLQSAQGGGGAVKISKEKEAPPPKGIKISDVFKLQPILFSYGGRLKSALRHHMRHIQRAPVKTALILGMALLFVIALSWLDATIDFTENEIQRLYATTPITGEVVDIYTGADGPMFTAGTIPIGVISTLENSGFVENVYHIAYFTPNLLPIITLPEDMELDRSFFLGDRFFPPPAHINGFGKIINCLDSFIYASQRPMAFGEGTGGEFELTFAPGFGPNDFASGSPVPVIVHESLLERDLLVYRRGIIPYQEGIDGYLIQQRLAPGDIAYLGSPWVPNSIRVRIIGTYSGGHPRSAYVFGQGLVIAPGIPGGVPPLASVSFAIYQEKVSYLHEFEYEMNHLFSTMRQFDQNNLALQLNDAELRMVVTPLEENLSLLQMLYPVAKGLAFAIALGLSLLLMLQNAKNIAILWVLGLARYKTRFNLSMEQLGVCLAGILPGAVIGLIMGVPLYTVATLVGIYLAGAVIGTTIGAVAISLKAPMELLQVRE